MPSHQSETIASEREASRRPAAEPQRSTVDDDDDALLRPRDPLQRPRRFLLYRRRRPTELIITAVYICSSSLSVIVYALYVRAYVRTRTVAFIIIDEWSAAVVQYLVIIKNTLRPAQKYWREKCITCFITSSFSLRRPKPVRTRITLDDCRPLVNMIKNVIPFFKKYCYVQFVKITTL